LKLVESVTHRGPVPELAAATQAAVNGSLDTAAIRAYALEHWSAANMYRQWENFIQTAATRRDTPILLGGRQQRPLRVAIVTPGLCVGGAEQWIAGMCLWLDPERACTVKVFVTIPGLIHQEAAGWIPRHVEIVETSTIPDDGSFDVLVSWGLVNLIELTAHISCPLIDVQHLVKPDEWWQQRAKTSTVAHALLGTHLVAVHAVALDNFPAHARGQVTIIANGADPGRVYPLTTREKVRQQLGIAENAKVVVYIGRLAPEKNVQALVDAAAYLDDSWRVVIIGPPGEALERLGPNVLVLPAKSHIGSWLGMSDVLCHPADTESHCYTINEAWLAGLPVVSCAYPVNRSFESQHGPMMWLVPVRPEPAVLAKAIQTAYVERHDPRVRRAQAVAQTEYVAPVSGRRWTDFLESVIAHPAH
jgi:glycosyltransferase involved in cell wall biosynthesis